MLAQDARGVVGALAALAIRDDFAVARQLTQALAQLIQGNVRRTGNEPSRAFVGTADIQQQRRAGIERSNFVPLRERHVTGKHVLRGHAGKVDGVFRRSVWRRVGQFQFGQIVNGHAGLERGGQHVNAFVHAIMADGLRAEQFACVGREQDFQRDGFGAGVVARVGAGVQMNRLERNGCATKGFLICARATGGEIEQSQDGCAPGVFVSGRTAENIVGGNAALAIRRTCQRNQRPLTRDSIPHLNGIAHGPDVRVAGLEMFVDADAAEFSDFQTGIFCQTHFRFYTQPEHD